MQISVKKFFYTLFYIYLLTFTTIYIFCIAIIVPGVQNNVRATIPIMLQGTAYRPYVYRALVPFFAHTIISAIPVATKNTILQKTSENTALHSIFHSLHWNISYAVSYYVVLLFMYLSLLGFVFAFRYLMRGVYITSKRVIDLTTIIMLLGLPCLYSYTTYIYDFPTLFLFTLGLATLVRRKWFSYIFVFVLACFNKETTLLLLVIFAIYFFNKKTLPRRTYISLVVIQLFVFIRIKLYIDFIFIHNLGYIVYFLLDRNIFLLLHPYQISAYLQWLTLGYLVVHGWSEKPLFLKQSLVILIPLLLACLFFGFIDELRDYYEVYPTVVLLISFTIVKSLKATITSIN